MNDQAAKELAEAITKLADALNALRNPLAGGGAQPWPQNIIVTHHWQEPRTGAWGGHGGFAS